MTLDILVFWALGALLSPQSKQMNFRGRQSATKQPSPQPKDPTGKARRVPVSRILPYDLEQKASKQKDTMQKLRKSKWRRDFS